MPQASFDKTLHGIFSPWERRELEEEQRAYDNEYVHDSNVLEGQRRSDNRMIMAMMAGMRIQTIFHCQSSSYEDEASFLCMEWLTPESEYVKYRVECESFGFASETCDRCGRTTNLITSPMQYGLCFRCCEEMEDEKMQSFDLAP